MRVGRSNRLARSSFFHLRKGQPRAQAAFALSGGGEAPRARLTGDPPLPAIATLLPIAAAALDRDYGVAGNIRLLPGEYDLNLEIAAESARYVFKVMRAGCDPQFIEMQIAAMERARKAGLGASLPAIIRTRNGDAFTRLAGADGEERLGWLISFLPGKVLADVEPWTPPLAASIGALLSRLGLALQGFEHPLLARPQKWNLLQAGWIGEHLGAHPDGARRERIESILSRFQGDVLPRLKKLPLAAIYNDANDLNIFVGCGADGALRATGIIDFGDMVLSPRVCDAAIAMAYVMMGAGDGLGKRDHGRVPFLSRGGRAFFPRAVRAA